LLALGEALAESRLDLASVERERIGVAIGSSTGGMPETECFYESRLRSRRVGRLRAQLLATAVAAPGDLIATAIGALGPRLAPSTACSSSAIAIAMGMHWIRQGRADVVLTGGADALCRLTFTGFHALQALAPEPCRPFDRRRQGLSLGEGAGILVLESERHARGRGASVQGEIAGAGLSCDAAHPTAPHGESRGAVQALSLALADAGVRPGELAYLNAHGTGTQQNDAGEAQAIGRICGPVTQGIAVSSSKGLIGHLLGAAGAVETIVTVLAMQESLAPPSVGLAEPDPACDLDLVMGRGRALDIPVAASNSYGFGGNNCTLVLRAP
jgi:3-oxoacyl-[acyl-carrier-protein] synthase II